MIVVQVGANRGNDELTSMLKGLEVDRIILVEPMSKFNKNLLECYSTIKNVHIENVAITDDPDKRVESFYLHEKMDEHIEQASLLKSHIDKVFNNSIYTVEKTYEEQLVEVKVDCCTINNLFEKYNISKIDILFIDAEGFDDRIIKSINFEKFNISKIYYENMHIDNVELSSFLTESGYSVTRGTSHTANNSVAVKQSSQP